ncbi:uncharacterized protein L3040_002466 [Drepanopeziza brunnea f. sp. 'multigermtubi']|nr:hypothetical protein L3040_002466 [Drepanopeziza brunnea f. sp. 'multigermtubi']
MSKIPVLGLRNGALSKNVLRKAAIMNRVRRRMDAARDFMHTEREKARERLSIREIVLPKPRHLDAPLPPSPLGLSNYDAFDLEDEAREDWDDEEGGSGSKIYSDFNIMNPTSERNEDDALDDYLDAIDGIHPEYLPDTPPAPPEGCIAEMLRENQQGDSFFVQIRD